MITHRKIILSKPFFLQVCLTMCGILGIIGPREEGLHSKECFTSSLSTLSKRGPDAQLTYFDDNVSLGHARLSILDTSDNSNQPFWDATENYCLVFNGEIFNHHGLRNDLSLKGVEFRTSSDTETLLYLLIEYGVDCINRLNGFFSFCFYDKRKNHQIIARDRYGIKPLLYRHYEGRFIFSSELKAILPLIREKNIDRSS